MAHGKRVLTTTHGVATVRSGRIHSGPGNPGLAKTKGNHMKTEMGATPAKDKPSANGAKASDKANDKPSQAAQAAQAAQAGQDSEGEQETRGRRGVIPTMPGCIIYRQGGKVFAAVHHPVDGTSYIESGKGEGSAKGALEDSGFRLSAVYAEGKEWIAEKLPEGAELIGYADIKGFPLPKQG